MRIGIIGAGNIGGALTRRFAALGHEVRVANSRGPETLAELARESGATAVPATGAAEGADVVVITIPLKNVPQLPRGILDRARPDAAIIDTCNYYPQQRDGRIAAIEEGMPESVWVSEHVGRPVIKVFNMIGARGLEQDGKPPGTPGRLALPVAGDDPAQKQRVMDLVDALGFDPVDAGSLSESWRQQPGTPVYGGLRDAAAVREALAQASPERPAGFRA
jgi:predicted dinucleotide-binding enzyme